MVARPSLVAVVLFAAFFFAACPDAPCFASQNPFPIRLISGTTTALVDELQITNSAAITLIITNLPGGGRRALLGILGTGGTNSGSAGTPVALGFGLASSTSGGTDTVYVTADTITTNGAPAKVLMTTNSDGFVRVSTSDGQGTELSTNDLKTAGNFSTNKSGFAIIVLRGADGSDTYSLDGSKVALVASNNTFSATNTFTGPAFHTAILIVSNDVSLTGTLYAPTLNGVLNGTNLTGNGTIGTNLLQATGASANTYGSSSQVGQFTLNDRGQIVSAGNVAIANGNAIATNAISLVVANGTSNSPLVTLIFSNLDVHVLSAATSTVGFAQMPFYTINAGNAGTNFVMHGSALTITNVNAQGLVLTNSGSSTLTFGGFVSNLTAVGGGYIAISSNNSNTVQLNTSPGASSLIFGGGLAASSAKVQFSAGANGQAYSFAPDTVGGNGGQIYNSSGQSQAGHADFTWGGFSVYGGLWADMNAGTRGVYIDSGSLSGSGLLILRPGNLVGSSPMRFGSNTNFPGYIAVDAVSPSAPTNANQNSNWTYYGTDIPGHRGMTIVASNMNAWIVGRATQVTTNVAGVATNATDANMYPTNRFAGFYFGAFGTAQSNLIAIVTRDDTNGARAVWSSTNAPSHLQVNTTNSFASGIMSVYSFPNQPLAANAASITIWNLNFADTNYVAKISPSYATTTFWSSKTSTSITLNVATVDPANQQSLDVELQHQ